MSIKNLFGKQSGQVLNATTANDLGSEVESEELVKSSIEEKEKYVPNVDFSDPSNFAKFGSAEKYYFDAIRSIYRTYPYDGSLSEKTKWHISSSHLTNYIFDNEYPRTNGYIFLGREYGTSTSSSNGYSNTDRNEYIFVKGGPNLFSTNSKKELFEKSNKFNTSNKRSSNLSLDGTTGNTVEFFFKRDNFLGSEKQVIFDLWNNSGISNPDYGRFKIEVRPGLSGQQDKFYIEYSSGSNGVIDASLGTNLNFTGSWNHYAITAKNLSGSIKLQLFVNSLLNNDCLTGSSISAVSGAMLATIGSLITSTPGGHGDRGWGKLSGSLDEFRYWKVKRSDKDISRFWFTDIGGGTNTDDANTDLGVYYKFNEGIFNTTSVATEDALVLDYSGRISNGAWTGYSLGSRTTSSAIVESLASEVEFRDPIIYALHPDVVSLRTRLETSGSFYDLNNNSAIYNSLPEHIVDEDQITGNGIKDLTQIMAEFFDDLYVKIDHLPKIKDITYQNDIPLPFAKRLLEGVGFQTADIFTNANALENFLTRNENQVFTDKINNVKNSIYQNIYNNILYIYRSKGTEKSIRNLLRCFGIDEEIVKINLYSNDTEYTLDDRFQYKTEKKKYIDFNHVDRFDSTVYQNIDPSNINSLSYINNSPSTSFLGNTIETEIIFPKKFNQGESFFFRTDFVSASLFGLHEAVSNQTVLTWANPDNASIQVFAVRPEEESKNVRFFLTSSCLGVSLTSPLFYKVYDDQKWNFAVKLKHEKYPYSNSILGTNIGNYILEFYGVNTVQDIVQEEFILSASVSSTVAENFFNARKRLYVGAHRTNFTGSIVVGPGTNNEHFTDVKIGSARYWLSYLDNDIIKLHSKDIFNFGSANSYNNIESYMATPLSGVFVPQSKTLALHWDFSTVSSSNGGNILNPSNATDAIFYSPDISSGSLANISKTYLGNITEYHYTAKGELFPRNDTNIVSMEYVYSGKRSLPENINADDLTNIIDSDSENFARDTRPVNHFFALEKSMYQNISQEMLKWIGTIKDFNNIIGEPKNRYQSEYKGLKKLRQIFFQNVDNIPDFERFVDFYKWIDDGITKIIQQLIPASMNISKNLSNVVESHILERSKYRHKIPTFEFMGEPPTGIAKTINELKYSWENGSAPISRLQTEHTDWWLERAERNNNNLNTARADILTATLQTLNRKFTTVYDFSISPTVLPYQKARNIYIAKNEVGFDLTGRSFIEFTTSSFYLLPNEGIQELMPPGDPIIWFDGGNVDGAFNSTMTSGSRVSSWFNRGSIGISAIQNSSSNRPRFYNDGLYQGIENSGSAGANSFNEFLDLYIGSNIATPFIACLVFAGRDTISSHNIVRARTVGGSSTVGQGVFSRGASSWSAALNTTLTYNASPSGAWIYELAILNNEGTPATTFTVNQSSSVSDVGNAAITQMIRIGADIRSDLSGRFTASGKIAQVLFWQGTGRPTVNEIRDWLQAKYNTTFPD